MRIASEDSNTGWVACRMMAGEGIGGVGSRSSFAACT